MTLEMEREAQTLERKRRAMYGEGNGGNGGEDDDSPPKGNRRRLRKGHEA